MFLAFWLAEASFFEGKDGISTSPSRESRNGFPCTSPQGENCFPMAACHVLMESNNAVF